MEAHERLSAWIAAAKISQAEMARRCGYDRHNFHRVLKGAANPTLEKAFAIEAATGGVIPAQAWVKAA